MYISAWISRWLYNMCSFQEEEEEEEETIDMNQVNIICLQ